MRIWTAFKAFFQALRRPKDFEPLLIGQKDEEPSDKRKKKDVSHLRLLTLLQKSGRLVDFLKEDISGFSDAQVGAAARQVHGDCAKLLEEVVTARPVMDEAEGSSVKVPVGYDPSAIKIVGKVHGKPPYEGKLVHKGWKAHKVSLPKQVSVQEGDIICPAEVEVS